MFERGVGAQVAIAVEDDVAVAEVYADAVGSTADVRAERLQRRESGGVVDVSPLIPVRLGGEFVVAKAVWAVFGQYGPCAGWCPLRERRAGVSERYQHD